MPLTLACACEGDTNVSTCTLTQLVLHLELASPLVAEYGLAGDVTLLGGPTEPTLGVTTPGEEVQEFDLDIEDFVDAWEELQIELRVAGSTPQPLDPDKFAILTSSWYIKQVYTCTNPGTEEETTVNTLAFNREEDTQTCEVDDIIRMVSAVGVGSGGGALFNSSPLSPCQEVVAVAGLFRPSPQDTTIDTGTSTSLCLCAEGGTPPYTFYVEAGTLPCGMILDGTTGCISLAEGTDECIGSTRITFAVVDWDGSIASVTCNFLAPCRCLNTVPANSAY